MQEAGPEAWVQIQTGCKRHQAVLIGQRQSGVKTLKLYFFMYNLKSKKMKSKNGQSDGLWKKEKVKKNRRVSTERKTDIW